jgi:hypothetical protein
MTLCRNRCHYVRVKEQSVHLPGTWVNDYRIFRLQDVLRYFHHHQLLLVQVPFQIFSSIIQPSVTMSVSPPPPTYLQSPKVCRAAFAGSKVHQQVYAGVDETDYLSFRETFFNRWLDDPRIAIVVVEDVVDNLRQLEAFAIWTLPGHDAPPIPTQPVGTDLEAVKVHFDSLNEMEKVIQRESGDHYSTSTRLCRWVERNS